MNRSPSAAAETMLGGGPLPSGTKVSASVQLLLDQVCQDGF